MDLVAKTLEKLGAEDVRPTSTGYIARCLLPGHEDSTPSFDIRGDNGLWRCYGCKKKGNLPQLLARVLGISIQDAIRSHGAVELLESEEWPEALPAKREDAQRQDVLPEEAVAMYRLFCPEHMRDRGYTRRFLKAMEIGFDFETMRVVYPVRSVEGKLVGITRRATGIEDTPKYLHTKFRKGDHVYLGHLLPTYPEHVKGLRRLLFLCEGHTDALRLTALGRRTASVFARCLQASSFYFGGAVATMGGPPTATQARLCVRYSDNVCMALDNDGAGSEFEDTAIEMLHEASVRQLFKLGYEGKDPDEISGNDTVEILDLEGDWL